MNYVSEEERKIGYPKDGSNVVEKREYDKQNKRIYINKIQFLEGILEEEWNFYIGGHQILDRWLKVRKGKKLSLEDIRHFIKIIASIRETIRKMQKLDDHYDNVEKSLIPNIVIAKKLTHFN